MEIKIPGTICFALLLLSLGACNMATPAENNSIATDTATIAKGEASFNQLCSGCHNFRQDAIGPQLAGLTTKVSPAWIKHFIKNPQKAIDSGDTRARQLFAAYKSVMPSFSVLTDNESDAIVAFLHTHKHPDRSPGKSSRKGLINPIPDTITSSNMVVGLELLTQFPASADSGKMPLTKITKLDFQPGTGTSFVLDLRGKLYTLLHNKPVVYMDMAALRPAFIHQPGLGSGFGSFAFHPKFAKNGLIYTTHTEPAGSAKADFSYADSMKVTLQWVLTEWKADNPQAAAFFGKGRELLRINMIADIHGVQEITFNPLAKRRDEDYGLLFIGIGDGGAVDYGFPFLVHDPGKVWGSILRIDPAGKNSANGRYGIPRGNPFAKDGQKLGEIYAYGFRNPHRITWSSKRQMLVCNIGGGNIESVNLVKKGYDYGWPIREGNFLLDPYGELNNIYPLPKDDSTFHITYPVAEYDHDEGKAISGGYEYQGGAVQRLKGKFLFGDIPTGRLFYVELADIKQGSYAPVKEWKVSIHGAMKSLAELCGSKRVDLHFGRDAEGELYILTKADGRLYKLVGSR